MAEILIVKIAQVIKGIRKACGKDFGGTASKR